MMQDPIFHSFLEAQYAEGMALAACSDLLNLVPAAGPAGAPSRYRAEFYCRGLARVPGRGVVEHASWDVAIWFPGDYLRRSVHVSQVLSLGPMAVEPWHPNLAYPFICLELTCGTGLIEILYGLFDLFSWNSYATDDALNSACAQWTRNQEPSRFPVDRRPLKWRRADSEGTPVKGGSPP
jgi:hypothetical protein